MREPRLVRRRVSGAMPILKLVLSKAVMVRQVPVWEVSGDGGGRGGEGGEGTVNGYAIAYVGVIEDRSGVGDGERGAATAGRSVVLRD